MEIRNKKVKEHVDSFLLKSVKKGWYNDINEAVGDFYGWTDKVRILHESNKISQKKAMEAEEKPMILADYIWYPQSGLYFYCGDGDGDGN